MHMQARHKRVNDNFEADNDGFKQGYSALLKQPREELFEGLIIKSRALLAIAEEEEAFLAEQDLRGFADLQERKRRLTRDYAQACEVFHARASEFSGYAPALLDRLDALQVRIGETSRANNSTLQGLIGAARENTASTLLAAQEIGQITDTHKETL